MIGSLDEAWKWYQATLGVSRAMGRLGDRYWDELPWDSKLGRDNILGGLQSSQVDKMSRMVLADLDDLCILLLFSTFEAAVRDQVLAEMDQEVVRLHHPILVQGAKSLVDAVEHGSFYRVLEGYKGLDKDLVEELNQVRRYRNWVAHGRRGPQPAYVSPDVAYQRLKRFQNLLNGIP